MTFPAGASVKIEPAGKRDCPPFSDPTDAKRPRPRSVPLLRSPAAAESLVCREVLLEELDRALDAPPECPATIPNFKKSLLQTLAVQVRKDALVQGLRHPNRLAIAGQYLGLVAQRQTLVSKAGNPLLAADNSPTLLRDGKTASFELKVDGRPWAAKERTGKNLHHSGEPLSSTLTSLGSSQFTACGRMVAALLMRTFSLPTTATPRASQGSRESVYLIWRQSSRQAVLGVSGL